MKEIEITTQLNQTLEEVSDILLKQGFSLKEYKEMNDKYMTHNSNMLTKDNIIEVLKESVLIRYICINYKNIYKLFIYKNKEYENNSVLTEEKITINIDDTEKMLEELKSYNLDVGNNYDVKKVYTLIKKRLN